MKNPFSYSGIVTEEAFCNREKEQSLLLDVMKNSENILLFSHRKTGKSSLIFKVFQRLNQDDAGIKTIYIDLYGTLTEQDFIDAVFTGLTQIEPRYKKILKAIPGLKIVSSVDPVTGMPGVSVTTEQFEKKNLLEKAMQTLASYSKTNRLVVGFDEFQEIAGYAEEGFEKRLRAFIQWHDRISYLFAGSQTHLLSEMFNTAKRPFYQSARSFSLEKIEKSEYVAWARNLFAEKGVDLSAEVIENVVERCDFQPLYIQQFLYELWRSKNIDLKKVSEIEKKIIKDHWNEYIGIFDGLTLNQKKALKLIAQTDGRSLYQTEMLSSVGFKSGSMLNRAIKSLLEKELVSKNGRYQIQDIMFKKWILII